MAPSSALALAVLLTSLSCAEPPGDPPARPAIEPVAGGTAIVAAAADITGINPLLDSSDAFNGSILDMLYLQLFDEQPEFADGPPGFEPELAAAWEWAADGRTLAIELRPGVVWDDGVPVTADDVVWTWRLQTDEDLGWPYGDSKSSILDIEAVDAGHLRVRFATDSTSRLADLNQGHIVPRHRWRELPLERWRESGTWFRDHQVVNGPFRLADWQPDQQIVLERNPTYYRDGYPRLDRVVFRIVPETNSRLGQLLAGTVDFAAQVPAADAGRIEAGDETRLEASGGRQYTFVHWNLERPPLAEIAARQALVLAIDRERIVDTLWFGRATVGSSPIVSTVWAHRDDPGPWPHDPDRARRLLAELGWRDGDGDGVLERDGQRFSFELLTNADSRVRTDAAVMIQEDLRRIGVEVRVRQLGST
jgi:peptide/nickel transport system substrate-binding protein